MKYIVDLDQIHEPRGHLSWLMELVFEHFKNAAGVVTKEPDPKPAGVYVIPGDLVQWSGDNVRVATSQMFRQARGWDLPDGLIPFVRGQDVLATSHTDLKSPDGEPVLGFKE